MLFGNALCGAAHNPLPLVRGSGLSLGRAPGMLSLVFLGRCYVEYLPGTEHGGLPPTSWTRCSPLHWRPER